MQKRTQSNLVHLRFAVLAVDIVLFSIKDDQLYVRLINVDRPPFFPSGSRGFPGGLIDPIETAEAAVARHLKNKADINPKKVYYEQLYTFSAIKRDPRGRVVAVSYLALVPWEKLSESEKQSDSRAWWSEISDTAKLAYDHDQMLAVALERLRSRVASSTIISKILPDEFTLGALERAYALILNKAVDKRNFRKKIIKLGILKELPYKQIGESHRPARLFTFKSPRVSEIEIL